MSTCISYVDIDKFIIFFHHLPQRQSETVICKNNLNFCQKVMFHPPLSPSPSPEPQGNLQCLLSDRLPERGCFAAGLQWDKKVPEMLLPFPGILALLKTKHKFWVIENLLKEVGRGEILMP